MACSAMAQELSTTESKLNQLYALDHREFKLPEKERAAEISRLYRQLFSEVANPLALRRTSDKDLTFVYRAAEIATFYTNDSATLKDMRIIMGELERRKLATNDQRASLYRAMIGLRRFDAAREYLAANPDLDVEQVPEIGSLDSESSKPVIYLVAQNGRFLQPRYFDIDHGTKLVVVSHPLCAFSRRAMETIAADTALGPIMARHATWLAPADQRLHLEAVSAWNRDHPSTPIVIARHRTDWPMFDAWATPQFYLLRNGKLLAKFSGWPKEGNREKLIELLAKGGLSDAE